MDTNNLSVVIITRNEEIDLPGCLESITPLRAEIIVVDNHSEDRTPEIARKYTPHVFTQPFSNYASQKQSAVDRATRDWVLSVDADERVTPALAREIIETIGAPGAADGYNIPFEVEFMGRTLRFGGPGAETHLRLFRRSSGRFVGGKLHEGIEVRGACGRLNGKIRHIPYRDLDEYLTKMTWYTSLAAQKRWESGRRFTPLHLLLPFWEFFVRIVLRLGILDGIPGIAWAGLNSIHTWVKFLKLRELEQMEPKLRELRRTETPITAAPAERKDKR